jgi:hypothetical protein
MAFYSTANLVLSTQTTATVRESPTEKFQIQDFESTFVTHPSPNNLAFASCQPLVTGPQEAVTKLVEFLIELLRRLDTS